MHCSSMLTCCTVVSILLNCARTVVSTNLPLPFPFGLGFSGAFLAPFLPSAAGAGGGGAAGGFKMILEPASVSSGKSGYSPVSGSLFSRNHALICNNSWLQSVELHYIVEHFVKPEDTITFKFFLQARCHACFP